jgi:predicted NBD/HSP70 family sugar kinase
MHTSADTSRRAPNAGVPVSGAPRNRVRKNTPVEQLRVRHCMEVVLALRDHAALSRVDLCKLLKRSPTTMTKVIADLIAAGWIAESAVQRSVTAGRPRTILQLIPEIAPVLAVVVEPDAVHCAVLGLDIVPRDVATHALAVAAQDPAGSLRILANIFNTRNKALLAAGQPAMRSMAIVVPGMTDTRLRKSLLSPPLGWRNLCIADSLEPLVGVPVVVYNNTRAMGFAEFRHLRLHEDQPLLFVQARFGLGAALVNSATPSHHGHYGVSELGHIPFSINRFSDRVAGDSNLVSVTNEAYLRAVLASTQEDGPVLPLLEQRRDAGDKLAAKLYAQTQENLAVGLGIAVNLLNPRVIVLGGIYALASPRFLSDLAVRLGRHAHDALTQDLQLQCSALGRSGALQGAAIVAYERLLRAPETYQCQH